MSGASEVLPVRRLGCVFNIDAHVVKVNVVGEHGRLKFDASSKRSNSCG